MFHVPSNISLKIKWVIYINSKRVVYILWRLISLGTGTQILVTTDMTGFKAVPNYMGFRNTMANTNGKKEYNMINYQGIENEVNKMDAHYKRQIWNDFKEMIRDDGYPIRDEIDNALLISVGEDSFIEIFALLGIEPRSFDIQVKLWGHTFNSDLINTEYYGQQRYKNLYVTRGGVMVCINKILKDIEKDKVSK